jgi:serine/threonine protein kinase
LRREHEAFQQVRAIRHPFLLGLDRVELVENELVMVMPLADQNLGDRFDECAAAGLPGIPRDELIGYLREAAEALDVIGTRFGLQHLDVKPANLFLTAGHAQVGDYGLVSKLDRGTNSGVGYTPRYVAPEVLGGSVHTRSDQYSLALVYQELLTGTFPFNGTTSHQLIFQHASATPDLSGLRASDRPVVARALSKRPDERFGSCREFIAALAGAASPAPVPERPRLAPSGVPPAPKPAPADGTPGPRLPRLVGIKRAPSREPDPPPPPRAEPEPPPAEAREPNGLRLPLLLSVLPLAWLRGGEAPEPELSPTDLVRAVLSAAGASAPDPSDSETVTPRADGSWGCRFLTTIDPRIARVKLDLLWEKSGSTATVEGNRILFRLGAPPGPTSGGLFGGFAKKPAPAPDSGLEVEVRLPERDSTVGRVSAVGRVFGTPPPAFAKTANDSLVRLLEGVRDLLNNVPERRAHPRVPAEFPINLFPVDPDGRVGFPLSGQCQDVSGGGVAVRVAAPVPTGHAYLLIDGIPDVTDLAILMRVVRTETRPDGTMVAGRFRMDLWPDPAT